MCNTRSDQKIRRSDNEYPRLKGKRLEQRSKGMFSVFSGSWTHPVRIQDESPVRLSPRYVPDPDLDLDAESLMDDEAPNGWPHESNFQRTVEVLLLKTE